MFRTNLNTKKLGRILACGLIASAIGASAASARTDVDLRSPDARDAATPQVDRRMPDTRDAADNPADAVPYFEPQRRADSMKSSAA